MRVLVCACSSMTCQSSEPNTAYSSLLPIWSQVLHLPNHCLRCGMWAAALPMLSTQRVLEPPPRGYVAEWQVRLEVAVWAETTVYAAFPREWQQAIETEWLRGAASIFWVPNGAETWKIHLDSMMMQRVHCQLREQHTRPIRRVFVPAGTAFPARPSSESREPVEWT